MINIDLAELFKALKSYGGAGFLTILLIVLLTNIENAMKIDTGVENLNIAAKIIYIISMFSILIIVALIGLTMVRKESGNNDKQVVIKGGNKKIAEMFLDDIDKLKPSDIVEQNDEEIVKQLKKDILLNSEKMSVIVLIGKAYSIAELSGDKKTLKWLSYELYGYPNDKKKIPEYRKNIPIRLDVGIVFVMKEGDKMLDLRESPVKIQFGGGLVPMISFVESSPTSTQLSFTSPLLPEIEKVIKGMKLPISPNFNPQRTPYLIDRVVIESLISKVKQEVLSYVSTV